MISRETGAFETTGPVHTMTDIDHHPAYHAIVTKRWNMKSIYPGGDIYRPDCLSKRGASAVEVRYLKGDILRPSCCEFRSSTFVPQISNTKEINFVGSVGHQFPPLYKDGG